MWLVSFLHNRRFNYFFLLPRPQPGTLAVVDQRAAVALSAVAGHERCHHVVLVQRDERLPGRTLGVPSRQRGLRMAPGPAAARWRRRATAAAAARTRQQAQVGGTDDAGHGVDGADVGVAEQLSCREKERKKKTVTSQVCWRVRSTGVRRRRSTDGEIFRFRNIHLSPARKTRKRLNRPPEI